MASDSRGTYVPYVDLPIDMDLLHELPSNSRG